MSTIKLFTTQIYQAGLVASKAKINSLNQQILAEVDDIVSQDVGGKNWSKKNYVNGFTSYASSNQLHQQSSTFVALEQLIRPHLKKFVKALELDIDPKSLSLNSCWLNVMHKNTTHSLHLHPLSVFSGTYYVKVPKGSSGLKFEDPRLSSFMAAPPKKANCKRENASHYQLNTKEGTLVLFESWLRHEVPLHEVTSTRISVSFNFS